MKGFSGLLSCTFILVIALLSRWRPILRGMARPAVNSMSNFSRVPSSELTAAEALKSPFDPTPDILAEGKAIFLGRGTCFQCHGPEGKGDGGAAKVLPIQPRNFTNPKFKKYRTPGEMMWVLKNGSLGQSGRVPGTGMLPIVGQFLSEEDGWKVLLYELSLGGNGEVTQ